MKAIEKIISYYIKFLELFSTQKAIEFTFKIFQKTTPRKMLPAEINFYNTTKHYTLDSEIEPIEIYEKGAEDGELFILLHGWNSNLGRLDAITDVLVKQGYRCILFDMPGHGKSILKHTNLKKNSLVFEKVLAHLKVDKPINVLTHSFGSAAAAYTLPKTNYQINHLIYLTCLNEFEPIFIMVKEKLNLSNKVYAGIVKKGENLLGEPLKNIVIKEKTKAINYKKLSLFHDKNDKILPFAYSELLHHELDNSTLYTYENIGHSRMLTNEKLLKDLENLVKEKRQAKKPLDVCA